MSSHLSRRHSENTSRHSIAHSLSRELMAHSTGIPERIRNDESWVEISSQPSSSSLSSVDNEHSPDEIVTTGLRISTNPHTRQRTRHTGHAGHAEHAQSSFRAEARTGTSSQEEYEESESDDDAQVLTSSNEHILPIPRESLAPLCQGVGKTYSSSEEEGDEHGTAVGITRTSTTIMNRSVVEGQFTPQPNAFSHPPAASRPNAERRASLAFVSSAPRPTFQNRSTSAVTNSTGYGARRAVGDQDHDAALRASLNTLLSCAAAARGLPRREDNDRIGLRLGNGIGRSNAMPAVRMVPERELFGAPNQTNHTHNNNASKSPSPPRERDPPKATTKKEALTKDKDRESSKRKSSLPAAKASKKKRPSSPSPASGGLFYTTPTGDSVSPTLLTWVVSAGVVVLVSVVGFGAGYVIGREVGRSESLAGCGAGNHTDFGLASKHGAAAAAAAAGGCGREMIKSGGGGGGGGIRRLRWGGSGGRSVAV